MVRLKNNYFLVILVFVCSALFIQCKNQSEKTKSDKEDLAVSVDTPKLNSSKPKFNYDDLVNKTFLPVHLEKDGSYQYHGDIRKEFDMGEDRIRFRKNKIMHLMPIEWYEFYIHKKKYDSDWLQLDLIGGYNYHNNDTTNFSSHYFKFIREKKLLFFSNRRTSDHLEVFMDSAFIAEKEKSKSPIKEENLFVKYLIYKDAEIIMEGKKVKISVPFIKEHSYNGAKIFGGDKISNELEVKLLKGDKEDLFFVFGEGMCGACPNFSAIYDIKGNNLSYGYSIRMNAGSSKTLISKGHEDKIFSDYGFSDREVNIKINHADTPTYLIKDWH